MRKKGRSKYPQATIDKALDLLRGGASVREAAEAVNAAHSTVYLWSCRAHVKATRPAGRERLFDYDEICRLYRGGLRVGQIAERLKCSSTTVTNALDAGGIVRPKRGGLKRRAFSRRKIKWAVSLYEEGQSIKTIAADLGTGYRQVRALLLDEGVTLRGRGGGSKPRVMSEALQKWRLVASLDGDETWEHRASGKTCEIADRGTDGAERFIMLAPGAGRFPSREQALKAAEESYGINL